jgi:hypothetical protein
MIRLQFKFCLFVIAIAILSNCSPWIFGNKQFIPKDLSESFLVLDTVLSNDIINQIRSSDEDSLYRFHMGIGLWIRNNWGLWDNSRLAKWFKSNGVFHPDDMSDIILVSYHRYLNHEALNLSQQVATYQDFWDSYILLNHPMCNLCKSPLFLCTSGTSLDLYHINDTLDVYYCLEGHNWYYMPGGFYQPRGTLGMQKLDSIVAVCKSNR